MTAKESPGERQPITTVKRWHVPHFPNPRVKYRYEPVKGTSYRISFPAEK